MRCIVLGTTETSKELAKGIIESGNILVAMVTLVKEKLPNNSVDLKLFANEHGAKYYEIENINLEGELLKTLDIDILICNWPRILQQHILEIPKIATICPHSTKLPLNRGRHALHWSIVLGLNEGALTFFQPDIGVDTGDIILQPTYRISALDDINDLHCKVNKIAREGIYKILTNLEVLNTRKKQEGVGNYWRKRTLDDVVLDMRMSLDMIVKTVKSFCPPYPCAKLIIEDQVIDIVEAREVPKNNGFINMEHGKVYDVSPNKIILKCYDALVELTSRLDNGFQLLLERRNNDSSGGGDYVYPPTYYMQKYSIFL